MPTRFLILSLPLLFCTFQAPAQNRPAKPAPAGAAIGKPAPTFRLNDHLGNMVDVGRSSKHWTVLAFYPKAMTPG